ncbi:proline dehydrogenase family protein, partial [bacterium]|nr:proline dehydrogenase family protein [bacterium]
RKVIRRFIAGDTLAAGVAAAQEHIKEGFVASLDLLGEGGDAGAVAAAVAGVREVIGAASKLADATVSLKPTQIGLGLSPEVFHANLRRLLVRAKEVGVGLTLDMEGAATVDAALDAYEAVAGDGLALGPVLQAYLRRTPKDLERLLGNALRVRLCRGAYSEGPDLAHQDPDDIREAFAEMANTLLTTGIDKGGYPGFATHDPVLAESIVELAAAAGRAPGQFEFQMLHGVHTRLQRQLRDRGFTVRLYIPFGPHWYPYFMRRLAERPANLWFFARAVFSG